MDVVASDGTRLRVSVRGHGDPVVLLHGLGYTGAMWDGVVERLATTHQVVVPDLRGHGDSVPVVGGFGVAQQADDIRALLEALDLQGVVLVGHSAGGYAALEFVCRHPDVARARLRRLVTVGTAGSLMDRWERTVLRFAASRLFYALLGTPVLGRQVVRLGAFGRRPRRDWIEATRVTALACPRPTKAAWVREVSGTTVQDRLAAALLTPVTVSTGSRDRAVTPAQAGELARACGPFGTAVIVDGAGHMAPLEQPQAVADLVSTS